MKTPNDIDIAKAIASLHQLGDGLATTCGDKTEPGGHGVADESTDLQPLRNAISQIHSIAHNLATLYKIEDRHWTSRSGVRGSWGPDEQQPSG